MLTASVRFESVTPRDAALVVLEELSLSSAFRSWLFEAIGLEADSVTVLEARDSLDGAETGAPDADRRSVLAVDLERSGERMRLLLTVAIDFDAAVVGDGLERVRTRRDRALAGQFDDCLIVSLAPAAALAEPTTDAERSVDATVSLEALRERFAARETDRGDYRAALVAAAIDRGERAAAARATADGRRSALVDRYESQAADRDLPLEIELGTDVDLERVEDGDDPFADGTLLTIDAPSLGDDHRLVHDLESGTVDLRLPEVGSHLEIFAARYAGVIPTTATLLTAGDAVVLRQSVPPIDPADADSADADLGDRIAAALEAVTDLLAVAERVRDGAD